MCSYAGDTALDTVNPNVFIEHSMARCYNFCDLY